QTRMSESAAQAMREAVRAKRNILIAGATGTGKTTLLNALVGEMEAQEPEVRCGILETTREIQSQSPWHFQLETDAYGTDLERLLTVALRMRPDRLVVGEVRGREALTLIHAWCTGHPGGVSTVHANSAPGALRRLEQLASHGASERALRGLIGETIGVVVHVQRTPGFGPWVESVLQVHGHNGRRYELEELTRWARPAHEEQAA
ncbi:MAG: trbB, partial [Myxococcaceae bacterium]|nr:trbB [Myxococcaceae bacterium]